MNIPISSPTLSSIHFALLQLAVFAVHHQVSETPLEHCLRSLLSRIPVFHHVYGLVTNTEQLSVLLLTMPPNHWAPKMPAKSLLRTPDIIWIQICELGGPSSTTALSLVSLKFRAHVIRARFKQVIFQGAEFILVQRLQRFLCAIEETAYKDSRLANPRHFIK